MCGVNFSILRRCAGFWQGGRFLVCFAVLPVFIVLFSSYAFSQEVFLKDNGYFTELFLKISPDALSRLDQNDAGVVVEFNRDMSKTFDHDLASKLITHIRGGGKQLVVSFSPEADFAVFPDPEGLRFVASVPRQQDDVLLSYGVGDPLLRKDVYFFDEPVVEANLEQVDALMLAGKLPEAEMILVPIVEGDASSYYRQEALFKLGNLYMARAKEDAGYFFDASTAFDRFLSEFPDSNRLQQVRMLNAEVKKQAGQLVDAANAYDVIYNSPADARTRSAALANMGDIYTQLGQDARAIEVYEEYIANFKSDAEMVRGKLASLYLQTGNTDSAFGVMQGFDTVEMVANLDDAGLLQVANAYRDKGDVEKAEFFYRYISDRNSLQSPEALYQLAQLKKGDLEAFNTLLEALVERYPTSEFGLRALVEFAEANYASRSAYEWDRWFDPLYQVEDIYDLRPRADVVRIKAMYAAGDIDGLVGLIDSYITTDSVSDEVPYLLNIKEDVLYTEAENLYNSGDYKGSAAIYRQLLDLFPDSQRQAEAQKGINDALYAEARGLFDNGKYVEASNAVQERMRTAGRPLAPRWTDLLDESLYAYLANPTNNPAPNILRYKARDYLNSLPEGNRRQEVGAILYNSFENSYKEAEVSGNAAPIIALYDENRAWLDELPDQSYANSIKTETAQALLKLDLMANAKEIFDNITPTITPDYAKLNYALCEPPVVYDINQLPEEEFKALTAQVERDCSPIYAADFLKLYDGNPSATTAARYSLLKKIDNEREKTDVLNEIYADVERDFSYRFPGYESIYLDVGLDAFKKNNYSGAIDALRRYVDMPGLDPAKQSEGLYYLGKALTTMKENDMAAEYYRRLVSDMPDSVFKSMAKSELEDADWRKTLNQNQ